jgi:hypothetical protein
MSYFPEIYIRNLDIVCTVRFVYYIQYINQIRALFCVITLYKYSKAFWRY